MCPRTDILPWLGQGPIDSCLKGTGLPSETSNGHFVEVVILVHSTFHFVLDSEVPWALIH